MAFSKNVCNFATEVMKISSYEIKPEQVEPLTTQTYEYNEKTFPAGRARCVAKHQAIGAEHQLR